MKSRKYYIRFQKEWLTIDKYKLWLEAVPSDGGRALCKLCDSSFGVSNIRLTSFDSHSKDAKYMKKLAIAKSQSQDSRNGIRSFFYKDQQTPHRTPASDPNDISASTSSHEVRYDISTSIQYQAMRLF